MIFKLFDSWNFLKKNLNNQNTIRYFKVREIWWCKIGCNVGHEQDGKGMNFERPVLIIKKFNNRLFLAIPLTTKTKNNKYYIQIKNGHGAFGSVIISQIRLLDSNRLENKIGYLSSDEFVNIKKSVKSILD